jgi:hypothetical protein
LRYGALVGLLAFVISISQTAAATGDADTLAR